MGKLSDDLTFIATRLMLAVDKSEILKITNELSDCIGQLIEKEQFYNGTSQKKETAAWFLKFTEKEISKMPKSFKKEFRTDGCTARITKRRSGKNTFIYEIRYRRNGYNVSASSKDLAEAKKKFIEALKTAQPVQKNAPTLSTPKNFAAFAKYYFETFRRRKVATLTFKLDTARLKKNILPYFGEIPIEDITPIACQKLLDSILAERHGKTADEVYSLLNGIFKSAIAHGIIERNPLAIVLHTPHERQNGKALTLAEEKTLIETVTRTRYATAIALALYAGLRPNEIPTAQIEGPFIVAVNSKRKTKRIEYKKIPITPMLRPFITEEPFTFPSYNRLRLKIGEILPNHKLYDLRTTFYTRCKEYDVADAARDEFVGHSLGALGNAYTDLSDEYLLKEAEKLAAWEISLKNVPQNVPQNDEKTSD